VANLLRHVGRTDEALTYYLRGAQAAMATVGSDDDSGALALAAALLRDSGRRHEADRFSDTVWNRAARSATSPRSPGHHEYNRHWRIPQR
jgi:hypothetical protein